jgi:hypothetical protein
MRNGEWFVPPCIIRPSSFSFSSFLLLLVAVQSNFMKKYIIVAAIAFLPIGNAVAQTAEDSVKAVINKMFAAMKNADPAALKAVLTDSALLHTIITDREGRTLVRNQPFSGFIDFISKQQPGDADERIEFEMIKIDGPLASVWTPYKFYYKKQFSHCGVNSFQLVKIDNSWKVQYIIDTRRAGNCE